MTTPFRSYILALEERVVHTGGARETKFHRCIRKDLDVISLQHIQL